MQLLRRFLCVLLVAFLLMPLSVAAEANDRQSYSDLFNEVYSEGRREKWKKAFTDDPRLFVSVLSEEKYSIIGTVTSWTFDSKDVEKNGDTYKQTLLTMAKENELNQAERRVVKWMLQKFGTEYDMWSEAVDYQELFSRCAETDGALAYFYAEELEIVFFRNPYRFLQEMSDSDADLKHLPQLLMEEIYYWNYDRQEIEDLLQGMENSGKLNDAQRQMIQQLWDGVDALIDGYGPLPERSSSELETQPTETPTEPAPEKPDEENGILIYVGIGVLLTAVIVVTVVAIRRKKT